MVGTRARHRIFLSGAFALLSGIAAGQDLARELQEPVNPRTGATCPSPKEYLPTRPDPLGVPTTVALGLFFQDISNLNDVDQSLSADVYYIARWRDARLANPLRGEGSAECPVPGDLWMPSIEPENLKSRQQFYDPHFLVNAKGIVTYTRRTLVQVTYPLDFRDFPFDRHNWIFTLWPAISRTDEMVLQPLERFVQRNERVSIQGWIVGKPVAKASTDKRPARVGDYSRLDIAVELDRDWSYYAWKTGLPLVLIVLMAYCVYFIPSSAASQQVGLGMTSMLTLIAYMLSLSSSLPKISYLTRADRFFVGSAILVFFGLMKGIFTIVWMQKENHKIDGIDRAGRWFYPIAMLINVVAAFFW
jgi:hypothetical protein